LIGAKFDGLIFKLKFEHFSTRKDFKLANLIHRYLEFDSKARRIGVTFIVLLKMN